MPRQLLMISVLAIVVMGLPALGQVEFLEDNRAFQYLITTSGLRLEDRSHPTHPFGDWEDSADLHIAGHYGECFATAALESFLSEDLLVFSGDAMAMAFGFGEGDAGYADVNIHNDVSLAITRTSLVRIRVEIETTHPGAAMFVLRRLQPGEETLVLADTSEVIDERVVMRPGVYRIIAASTAVVQVIGEASDRQVSSIDATVTLHCLADFDGDGELTIFDFLAFQAAFDVGEPIADIDGDGELTFFDFLAFANAFDEGCD